MAVPDTRRTIAKPPKKLLDEDKLSELAKQRLAQAGATLKPPAKSETNTSLEGALRPVGGWDRPNPATPGAGAGSGGQQPDEDDLSYLARLRAEQARVRKATEDELKAGKAKASLDAGARAGAAGLGLSGATAALQSDIGRQQDRAATLTLNELDRAQNDEEFEAIQREGAILDYEDAYDLDLDGDGFIGGIEVDVEGGIGDGNPDNNPEEELRGKDLTPEARAKALKDKNNAELQSEDLYVNDRDTAPGTIEEPYIFVGNVQKLMDYLRGTGGWPLSYVELNDGTGRTVAVDRFGNHYLMDRGAGPGY